MIEKDPRANAYLAAGVWGRVTLDALFRRNVRRDPDRVVLIDPADRAIWNGSHPLRWTGTRAEQAVSALACRFQELGLKYGSVVGVQMPNISELILTILACQRAGLVPALMPLLWREHEIASALEGLAPKAIITVTRMGDITPADHLRYAAADLFSIRFVMAFGDDCPDGVMSLDECLADTSGREPRPLPVVADAAGEPAMITFRTTSTGHVPVARNHNHWITAGLALLLEAQMESGETIATSMVQAGFAGLASSFMPWLLSGGTLALHQPFDLAGYAALLREEHVTRVLMPGLMLPELMHLLALDKAPSVRSLIGVFSDVRRYVASAPAHGGIESIDVVAFDEWGLVARKRDGGISVPLPLGAAHHPADSDASPILLETRIAASGRLHLRGPMVPYDPAGEDGYRTTSLQGRDVGGTLELRERTDHVAMIGGLGAGTDEIATCLLSTEDVDAVVVSAMPDALFGERIEARIAPRTQSAIAGDAILDKIRHRLEADRIAPHKIPSRIVIDPMVRADPAARHLTRG